jgi:hypothetical protein
VTNKIYNLMITETPQARRDSLNQRKTRVGTLERLLQSQANEKEFVDPSRPAHLAELNSSDEEAHNDLSLEELSSITKYLVHGSSFEMLRIGLSNLAYPETGIADALRTRHVGTVETILSKQFDMVAIGMFDWIRGAQLRCLHEAGNCPTPYG